MLHSTFTSAVARGGSSGGSDYSREFFNFPMTIASEPPSNPSQGVREGHVWLVMTQDQKNTLHNIVFDAYSQTVVYQPGTLVIIVPRFGNNRVYVNQTKSTGDSTTPLVYSTSDDLETLWPVTVVSDNQIQVKMEISKPWQYAKLITPSSFDNIPLYYFNGKAWEAPRTWDYIYWSNLSDGTVWQAYQMNTETFTPIKENMPDFDLNPIVKTILASESYNVQPHISVMSKGGFAVLGLKNQFDELNSKSNFSDVIQWWSGQPHWYFLKINKRGVSYLGRCNPTAYNGEFPFVATAVRNSVPNQVDYEATDFCVFLQTSTAQDSIYPNYLYFRRYYFDEASGTMKYTDTNKVSLGFGLTGATFDPDSREQGWIAYSARIRHDTTINNTMAYMYLARFSIKDNILTIDTAAFSAQANLYNFPQANVFCLYVYNDMLYFKCAAGSVANTRTAFLFGIQPNKTLSQINGQVNQGNYLIYTANPKYDGTDLIYNNGNYVRCQINKTNANVYSFGQLENTTSKPIDYEKNYVYSNLRKRIPGPRDDTFVWQTNIIQKQNPNNENLTLPVDQIGVNGMISKSQCGSGLNMAIASLLKP